MKNQEKIKAIIVDDEQSGREVLAAYLEQYCPEIQVMARCNGVESGLAAVAQFNPQVLFLDIEMPHQNGFELLKQLPEEVTLEVVFVTAYHQFAIKAFRFNALDYLLKPINIEELVNCCKKLTKRLHNKDRQKELALFKNFLANNNIQTPSERKIALAIKGGFEFRKVKNIVFCQANGPYTNFHFKGENQYMLINGTLHNYETLLADVNFLRPHRSYLINPAYIKSFQKGRSGNILLEGDYKVPVSRTFDFEQWIANNGLLFS